MNILTEADYNHAIAVKELLTEKFGDSIYQIYCYGSRVTKQVQDTDFDLLIVTKVKIDWRIEDAISSLIFNYGVDNNILFDTRYFSKEEFENTFRLMPLIKEVKNAGLVI